MDRWASALRHLPIVLGVSATASTARGTSSAVAGTAQAEAARRRLCANPMASPAPPTLSAATASAPNSSALPGPSALRAAQLATSAPPKKRAVVAELSAPTASVASRLRTLAASSTRTAVQASATTACAEAFDCFSTGFPCIRSGHSAVGAPDPPSCPYAPNCVEYEFCELRLLGLLGSSSWIFCFVTFVVTLGRRWCCRVVS